MKSAVLSISSYLTLKTNSKILYPSALLDIVAPTALVDYQFRSQGTLTNYGSVGGSLALTRSGNGTFIGSNGLLQTAGTNVARFDFDPVSLTRRGLLFEGQTTNEITYSDASTAVVPSTLPTGWASDQLQGGIARSIVGVGSINGIPYVDIRFAGTTTNGNFSLIRPGAAIVLASTTQYTFSGYSALISGAASTQASEFPLSTTSTLTRNSGTGSKSGTWFHRITIGWASGTTVDTVYRLGAIQAEIGPSMSSYILSSGSATTRFADAASVTGLPTTNVTLVEKPAGCATLSAGTLTLNPGYTIDRIMVLPGTYSADQVATIRGLM